MTDFEKYWQSLVDKNAGLSDTESKLTISVSSLQSQVKRAYDAGIADQKKFDEALRKMKDRLGGSSGIFGDIFK